MKKTRLAASVAALAALASSGAFAQNVTLYGRANLMFDNYAATGAAAGAASNVDQRSRVADTGSRFGFRVNEDLGGGLRAFVLCETGINIDNAAQAGQDGTTPNANTNFWCSREGHAGIGNQSMEVRLGRQNVFWTHGELNQTGANFLGADVLGAFYAASSGATTAVATRLANTVLVQANQGLAGAFAGSHVYYATTGENRGGTTAGAIGQSNAGTDFANVGSQYGVKVNFSQGDLLAMVDYGKQTNTLNNDAAAGNSDRSSWKVGLGYKYASGSLASLNYWQHDQRFSLAASQTYAAGTFLFGPNAATAVRGNRKQSGYGLNVVHNLGGGLTGYAQYAVMLDASGLTGGIADSGATGYTVGLRKDLSKRTGIYGAYHKITNEANNAINFTGGNYNAGTAAAGSDPRVAQVGIMHNF